jgi:hypothetical protein
VFDGVGMQRHMPSRVDREIAHREMGGFLGGEEHLHADPLARFLGHRFDRAYVFVQKHKIPRH